MITHPLNDHALREVLEVLDPNGRLNAFEVMCDLFAVVTLESLKSIKPSLSEQQWRQIQQQFKDQDLNCAKIYDLLESTELKQEFLDSFNGHRLTVLKEYCQELFSALTPGEQKAAVEKMPTLKALNIG